MERHQARLIESILTGYPIPEIYLWARETDAATGHARLSVVDGQQRIRAIMRFIENSLSLRSEYLDVENRKSDFCDTTFETLPNLFKQILWDYQIRIRTIPEVVSREQIIIVFKRLNETDKSINPQEFRNAEFNGEFINAAISVADMPEWQENSVFSQDNYRRMGDVQFASQLLIYLRYGIESEITQDAINTAYDTYNSKYTEQVSDLKTVKSFAKTYGNMMKKMGPDAKKMLRSPTHIYTLFGVLCSLTDDFSKPIKPELLIDKMNLFADLYYHSPEDKRVRDYREASRAGVLQKKRRITRFEHLKAALKP